jgi:hypothetical protein
MNICDHKQAEQDTTETEMPPRTLRAMQDEVLDKAKRVLAEVNRRLRRVIGENVDDSSEQSGSRA